jgi:hypothetical protein
MVKDHARSYFNASLLIPSRKYAGHIILSYGLSKKGVCVCVYLERKYAVRTYSAIVAILADIRYCKEFLQQLQKND